MKRYEMVKSHEDFNKIINNGKKISSKYVNIFSLKKEFNKPNFGVAVGKRLGNAVIRNKFKRIYRSLVDNYRNFFQNNYNYIIMIKKEAINANFKELEKDFENLLRKEHK